MDTRHPYLTTYPQTMAAALPGREEDAPDLIGQRTDPRFPIMQSPQVSDPLDLVGDIGLFDLENELLFHHVRKSHTPKRFGDANLTPTVI
jgi:hypothetical protein